MNPVPDEIIKETDPRDLAGQAFIRTRWATIAPATRKLLTHTGYYDQHGKRLQPQDPPPSWIPECDIEKLEWAVGSFKQCLAAKLPTPSEPGALIPAEALSDDVIEACYDILMLPQWHDPEFLRFAILAMATHEEANALTMTPPKNKLSVAGPFALSMFHFALILLVPYGLATGLVAAMDHELWSAVWGFYLVGVGINSGRAITTLTFKPPRKAPRVQDDLGGHFEYAYNAWQWFRLNREAGVTGGSAMFHIERMANEGINVPPVALDLCRALSARTQSLAAEWSVGN